MHSLSIAKLAFIDYKIEFRIEPATLLYVTIVKSVIDKYNTETHRKYYIC